MTPKSAGESVLMRGYNCASVTWVDTCRWGKEPRAGVRRRAQACTQVLRDGKRWCFNGLHAKGVAIISSSRTVVHDEDPITLELAASMRLGPQLWRKQLFGPAAIDLSSGVLDASTSGDQLRIRPRELKRRVEGLGVHFAR